MKVLFRAEPGYLMAYQLTAQKTMKIAGDHLALLIQWLDTGEINDYIQMLIENDFINMDTIDQEQADLKLLAARCQETLAPLRSMSTPEIMNIELTTRCPLRCPQCYCDLHQGRDIKKEAALAYIEQAAHLKIPFINLSGGETLVYPYLTELLEVISRKGLNSAIAISGWGFDFTRLAELKAAGVDQIYVSLNGSTSEVNARSRDGYDLAVNALRLLQSDQKVAYHINWVARNDNVADFPNMVRLARDLGVNSIVIIQSKPDASYVMQASLSPDSFLQLANFLKKHDQQEIIIEVEACYSPLRAYINNYYLWNRNTGVNKGCGAGRNGISVDVEGNLTPCRHLLYPESYASIKDYWWKSELLDKLRGFEDNQQEPCRSCYLNKNCVSCRAVADKVEKNIFSGDHYCPIGVMEK
ncbi:MAG: radical SAM protein [Syntrophomonas sp.]|nr:radical SAM protein [Syntrophomonas sp.]